MSNVAVKGNASGTGTFTIAAPNSNNDRQFDLPDEAGTVLTSASDIESQVKTATNATGSAPIYACRAWVNFDGTGTVSIRDSGNVSSITDRGVGQFTVNFSNAMPDNNYCAFTQSGNTISNTTNVNRNPAYSLATTSFSMDDFDGEINASDTTATDRGYVYAAVFR